MANKANITTIKNVLTNSTVFQIDNRTIITNNTNNISTNKTLNNIINTNITKNNINDSKPLIKETIIFPKINKNINTNIIFCLGIGIPIIIIILVIIIIFFIKRKKEKKTITLEHNDSSLEQIKIQMNNSQENQPYNKVQNTSGLNNMAGNLNNLSEIKIHNLKEDINTISSNNSGSSSGRRKREKKKPVNNNNIPGFNVQESQLGIQNEIKEQIRQYVIDEHNKNI